MDNNTQILHLKSNEGLQEASMKINFEDPIILKEDTECALLDINFTTDINLPKYVNVNEDYSVKYILPKINEIYQSRMHYQRNSLTRKVYYYIHRLHFTYSEVNEIYEYLIQTIKMVNEKAIEILNKEFNNPLVDEEISFNTDNKFEFITFQPIYFIGRNDEEYFLRRGIGRISLKLYEDSTSNVNTIDILQYYIKFGPKFKNILRMPNGFEDFPYNNNGNSVINPYTFFGVQKRNFNDFIGPKLEIFIHDQQKELYILCDILKPSYLNNEKIEILETIFIDENKIIANSNPPSYKPLKLKEIISITIKICDKNGKIFSIKGGYISLMLSFRPMR